MPTIVLKRLDFSAAMSHIHEGAAFVDMRPLGEYLDVHIPASFSLQYEFGPGLASRARDILDLEIPLVLIDGAGDVAHAAASLKGKGFNVLGAIEEGVNEWSRWHGTPASTEIYRGPMPTHTTVLDVGDPGATNVEGGRKISIEQLWNRIDEFKGESLVTIAAGHGLRAALAIGMLERVEVPEVVFWMTRD